MEEDNNKPAEQKPAKSYGRRPIWQWVLIYVVLAIIVYGLVYYFFIKDNGDSTGGSLGY